MDIYSGHINKLIEQLSRLPGVGAKSAQRLAFHIINMPESEVKRLADTMIDAKQHIHYCKECFTLTSSGTHHRNAATQRKRRGTDRTTDFYPSVSG